MTTPRADIEALVEDEWYAIRHFGEIPEVALYTALFHLTEDRGGPRLKLNSAQRLLLLDGARLRYLDITLRDLLPATRDSAASRGIKRSYINWQRFLRFCGRHGIDGLAHRQEVAAALRAFLEHEFNAGRAAAGPSQLNCSFAELAHYLELVGLDPAELPAAARDRCLAPGLPAG